MNLEKWKKFFCDSGIPTSEASTYAFKFYQNRIQTNMLVDLNKDYLKEMGITIMGDVIAILRHAKQVYEDIQKTGKPELPEEAKDKRKEKEIPSKTVKKASTDIADVRTETSSPKPAIRSTVKRKSEPTIPAKKSIEPVKKPKLPVNDDNIEECEDLGYVMIDPAKKAVLFPKVSGGVETQLKNLAIEKPEKTEVDSDLFNMSEDDDDDDDNVEVIINDPIVTPFNGYKKFPLQESSYMRFKEYNKNVGQELSKRTVFKRLGDDISQHSVSSTTAFEDEEQFSFTSKKTKEEAAKAAQEKNSVFQRLGQKCDVSSTSIDEKHLAEEKKQVVKLDPRDIVSKPNTVSVTTSKVMLNRKVKVRPDEEDPDSCLPLCVKSTFSEGILASSGNARKRSLKERLGLSHGTSRTTTRTLPLVEYSTELRLRKYTSNDSYQREKILSANSKKRVSFGSVSEKLIPSREEAIRNGELNMASERTSVFDRLGFNRTY